MPIFLASHMRSCVRRADIPDDRDHFVSFEQHLYGFRGEGGPGSCFGVVLVYLYERVTGGDFFSIDFRNESSRYGVLVRQFGQRETIFERDPRNNRPNVRNSYDFEQEACRFLGQPRLGLRLAATKQLPAFDPDCYKELVSILLGRRLDRGLRDKKTYHLIYVPRHVMAAYHNGEGKVTFFDVNGGQVRTSDRQKLRAFFERYFGHYSVNPSRGLRNGGTGSTELHRGEAQMATVYLRRNNTTNEPRGAYEQRMDAFVQTFIKSSS